MIDVLEIRSDFPILKRKINGKPLVYLDNAATTQKPKQVIEAIRRYYMDCNANVHRSSYQLSVEATGKYEQARKKVAEFIGANADEIIFTRNTTESLNAVSYMIRKRLSKKTKILLTKMEHHSNIVPWQAAAKATGAKVDYVGIGLDWKIDSAEAKEKLEEECAIFSFTHASNVIGIENDVKVLCRLARKAGAYSCVDAAQSVPHFALNVKEIGCDFLAFSGHKMCGPMGIGVLYIRKEIQQQLEPFLFGGNMIKNVDLHHTEFADSVQRFEAGTQNVAGAVGLAAAIDYLKKIGMQNISKHANSLAEAFAERIEKIPKIKIYGPKRKDAGLVSFNIGKIHPHDVAEFANMEGICIRAGHHCSQPLLAALGENASCRASFYIYNTEEEAEKLACVLEKCKNALG
ncbi:MAG: SufS family cysteine desulfurase [Candidatus Anstonellaceae archaeon]